MTELREKIADVLWPGLRERMAVSKWPHLLAPVLRDEEARAGRILAIPELQKLLASDSLSRSDR